MIFRTLVVVVFAGLSVGCRPLCEDTLLELDVRASCEDSGGTVDQCLCAWNYLAQRYTCTQIGTNDPVVSYSDAVAACN